MAMAPEQVGIGIRRHFTTAGVHPYDTVEWERRDARIPNCKDGTVAFEQLGVEFPVTWSLNATNIVAQKYFRGTLGTAEREWSLRQVIDRVADTITDVGHRRTATSSTTHEAEAFRDELKYLLVTQTRRVQLAGVVQHRRARACRSRRSACFILAVDDTMDSILNWYREEGTIFKGGSGSGINLSQHPLVARAPQGRRHRVAARSASCAAPTRRPARSSRAARPAAPPRWSSSTSTTPTSRSSSGARPSRSARPGRCATPASTWTSTARTATRSSTRTPTTRCASPTSSCRPSSTTPTGTSRRSPTGEVVKTVQARDLMRQIAQAAWECADPGMQFDTTINRWHTARQHRPHQRQQPVLASTCTSTTRRATSPASTC